MTLEMEGGDFGTKAVHDRSTTGQQAQNLVRFEYV